MAAVPVYLSILFAIAFANVIVQGDGPEQQNGTQPGIFILTASQSHHMTVEKKAPLLLNCSVVTSRNFGPVEFTWLKDGQPLAPGPGDRRIHVFQNGSLYFRRIIHRKRRENRLSDEGLYECRAGNRQNGSVVARRVHVEVAGIAKNFTKEPSPAETHVGGKARFDCSIKATPPATIVWQRDNVQLSVDDHRFIQLPSGALQIHNVSRSDEGSYRCMAAQNFNHLPDEVTNIKWKWSQQARLKVLDRPRPSDDMQLLAAPNNTTAMSGATVILECMTNGSPPPTIQWIRRGKGHALWFVRCAWFCSTVVPHDHKKLPERHRYYGGGNLMIPSVTADDAGVYQCVLTRGRLKQHHEATLNVLTYPVMITDPESNDWPITRTVSLFCDVEGNPKPTIMWYFNGVPIHRLQKENIKYELSDENTRLIVYTIRLENSGYYQCIAENTMGQVFAIARIGVFAHKDAPPPPQKVTLTPLSSSVLRMDWTQEPSDKPILAFLISHRIRDEGSLNEVQKTVGGVMRSHNLTNLLPYTTYVVTIRTFSRKGSSTEYTLEGRTLEGVPLAVPTFQVSSPSAETMLVEWEELAARDRGGVITQYQLQHRPAATPSAITTITVDQPQQRSYLVSGLKAETAYEVRLVAGTKNGFSTNRGGWSHHTTPKVSIDGAPQLKVDVLNSTAVMLRWDVLHEEGEGRGDSHLIQAVELRHMGRDVVLLSAELNPPAAIFVLTQLENNTDYEVTVFGAGRTVQVSHTFRITEGLLVPRASKLRSHVVNPSTVRLEWTPSVNNGHILGYQVCRKELSSAAADVEPLCMDSERPYAVVSDLKPFTRYQFAVRIVTDKRPGSFTTLDVLTSEDKPGPPVNLTYEVLKRGSVRLQWSPPSDPNGIITSYVIFYNLDSDVPDFMWTNLTKTGQQRIAQVDGLDTQQYFFKLSACTKAGRGHPSKVVMVYPDCISNTQCASGHNDIQGEQEGLTDKQVGIIIGVFIGVACIIICIIVILCRHR
ncbi:protogenin-like [Babylonia areolata]|uniref:protogenin-like n=1 Tax=Babylonia areolata TaxID=304850 RepID=UPI003FCF000D